MTVVLRRLAADEIAICHAIYLDAIHNGTALHYSAEQRAAWAPRGPVPAEWTGRMTDGAVTWLAECGDGDKGAVGFATLRGGYLDFLYVRPDARDTGAAGLLYSAALAYARAEGHRQMTTHASHLARRFLARRGWHVVAPETVVRNGVAIERFEMALDLA